MKYLANDVSRCNNAMPDPLCRSCRRTEPANGKSGHYVMSMFIPVVNPDTRELMCDGYIPKEK